MAGLGTHSDRKTEVMSDTAWTWPTIKDDWSNAPDFAIDESDEDWAMTWHLMQRVAQVMKTQGGGQIVIVDEAARDGGPAYRASQAALAELALTAAKEFKAYNIEVLRILDFRF